jgi:hypothetical protein
MLATPSHSSLKRNHETVNMTSPNFGGGLPSPVTLKKQRTDNYDNYDPLYPTPFIPVTAQVK